jgi:26S proteasome regulatory subunit N9
VQKTIEEAERVLDTIDGVTPVHSAFYELSSNFHQLKFNHAEYYRDVLRYFGCTDITTIPG